MTGKLKRDSLTILADVLRALASSRMSRKTSIVYRANLNYERIEKYLELLIVTGHVEMTISDVDDRTYTITTKGQEFLMQYDHLVDSIRRPSTDLIADRSQISAASAPGSSRRPPWNSAFNVPSDPKISRAREVPSQLVA